MDTFCYINITKQLQTIDQCFCTIGMNNPKREMNMKAQIKVVTYSAIKALASITDCFKQAPISSPSFLHLETHNARITNIIELPEKKAPKGKILRVILTGALIGAAVSNDASKDEKHGVTLGGFFGKHALMKKHEKTICRLRLSLDDRTQKEIFLRGGHYQIGSTSKVTVNKSNGEVTAFKLANS